MWDGEENHPADVVRVCVCVGVCGSTMKCYDRLSELKSTHAQQGGCQINGYYK